MKILRYGFAVTVIALLVTMLLVPGALDFQRNGRVVFTALSADVEIIRDAGGVGYVKATNLHDALAGQGFATAQDRLFQMHMMRQLAAGELAEGLGEEQLPSDRKMPTLGFYRAAKTHTGLLNQPTREIFDAYAAGVNRNIQHSAAEHPLELKRVGAMRSASPAICQPIALKRHW